jgi:hypothetical protein
MGQEKNAENIPFLRSTQPKSTERVPVVELSGSEPKCISACLIIHGRKEVMKIQTDFLETFSQKE